MVLCIYIFKIKTLPSPTCFEFPLRVQKYCRYIRNIYIDIYMKRKKELCYANIQTARRCIEAIECLYLLVKKKEIN